MSASTTRAIDQIPSDGGREMEVLCLGLSRTATMSMYTALIKLGHKPYHFLEVGQRELPNESHVDCWREAFIAKMYGRGKPYGKAEFDKLLRNYSAVTDAPCANFSEELVAAYPNAKVILTNRDPEKWAKSMETSYYRILSSPDWKWFRAVCALDIEFLGPYLDLLRYPLRMWTDDDWEDREKLKQGFAKHYARVRKIVPKENLLEWVPQDGYGPLCKFLGVPIPDEPFPHANKGDNAAKLHKPLGYLRAVILIAGYLKTPAAGILTVLCAWFAWSYAKRLA